MNINPRIVEIMRGPAPPQTAQELADLLGITVKNVLPRCSLLLNRGRLSKDDLPWRRDEILRDQKRRSATTDLETQLLAIMEEGGKDRVAAIRQLIDLRSMGGEHAGPPVPNDTAAMTRSLVRILRAAGPSLTATATQLAFPPPPDAQPADRWEDDGGAHATQENLAGPTAS